MGLKDVFKDIKRNVKNLDETMDRTDQEIDHFSRVLDNVDDSIDLFRTCITHTDECIGRMNKVTENSELLFSRMNRMLNIVDNGEMISMLFQGFIIVAFLLGILIIEQIIGSLIHNSHQKVERVVSFFGSVFDYLFISIICFILRISQLVLFTVVAYCTVESVRKTILQRVEVIEAPVQRVEIQPTETKIEATTTPSVEIPPAEVKVEILPTESPVPVISVSETSSPAQSTPTENVLQTVPSKPNVNSLVSDALKMASDLAISVPYSPSQQSVPRLLTTSISQDRLSDSSSDRLDSIRSDSVVNYSQKVTNNNGDQIMLNSKTVSLETTNLPSNATAL